MTTKSYVYTGSSQTFVVPNGVTSIQFTMTGGKGAGAPGGGGTGGAGGKLVFTHAVVPGDTLTLVVGGAGKVGTTSSYNDGAFQGGGNGGNAYQQSNSTYSGYLGSGGGGLTGVQNGSAVLLGVCGGGGAAGYGGSFAGGSGGGTTAYAGANFTYGGKGGTPSAGGAAGAVASGYQTGNSNNSYQDQAGGALQGGAGADPRGGGGGGGYFGGGGGGWYSDTQCYGGGGGSSYTKTTATGVTHTIGGSATSNGALSMVYSLPPNAPVATSPAANVSQDVTKTTTFQWTDSFNEAGDTQTAFDIQYRISGATSWTAVARQTSGGTQYTAAANLFVAGNTYEWQVRAVGAASGNAGAWSASKFFNAVAAPVAPTIVHPAASEIVYSTGYTVTWQAVSGQQAFRLQIIQDDGMGNQDPTNVLYDTGVIGGDNGGANTWPVTFKTGDYQFHTVLTVEVLGVFSPATDVVAVTSIDPPTNPLVVATAVSTSAQIQLAITNPSDPAYPPAAANNVYRSAAGIAEVRIAINVPVNSTFIDNSPASGILYTYRVTAVAQSGAETQ